MQDKKYIKIILKKQFLKLEGIIRKDKAVLRKKYINFHIMLYYKIKMIYIKGGKIMLKNVMIKTGVIAAAIAMFASMNVHAATKTSMKSAKEVVNEMGIGWNLGNTLDSHGEWIDQYTDRSVKAYETGWGNPETTKAMMDKVKEGGFKTVRVPVTWGPHIGSAPSYTVDKAWFCLLYTSRCV